MTIEQATRVYRDIHSANNNGHYRRTSAWDSPKKLTAAAAELRGARNRGRYTRAQVEAAALVHDDLAYEAKHAE